MVHGIALPAPVLTTKRLILRPWRDADFAPFRALNADPRVRHYFPGTQTEAQSDADAIFIRQYLLEHAFGFWAVEVPGVAEFIGFTGLSVPCFKAPFMPCVEIGWRLAFEYWGNGYASEAADAALVHGFKALELPEIVAFTVPGNTRSRAVTARIGMRHAEEDDFDHPGVPKVMHSVLMCFIVSRGSAGWLNKNRLEWLAGTPILVGLSAGDELCLKH